MSKTPTDKLVPVQVEKLKFKPNKYELPQPLYSALTSDTYIKVGDYSVSELIGPPQPARLLERHRHKLEFDPFDKIKSLLGTGVHNAIQSHTNTETHLAENRFRAVINGKIVTGQPDVFSIDDRILYDYKTTSTWISAIGNKREWEEQLNCYAWMLRQEDYVVDKLVIVAIYTDWSKTKQALAVLKKSHYPTYPVELFEIPMWEDFQVEHFLETRIALHEAAKEKEDAQLPECTKEDRWRKDTWAITTEGASRATKVFDSLYAAMEALPVYQAKGKDYYIEEREGQATRCQFYCDAAPFCHQLRKEAVGKELDPAYYGDSG